MTGVPRRAALVLGVAAGLGAGGPALAAEHVVQIGRDGLQPSVLQVEPGDTVRFVNQDPTFAYRAQSAGGPWRFHSAPTTPLTQDFVVPSALTRPGSCTYRVAQAEPFAGSVVVVSGAVTTAVPAAVPTAVPNAARRTTSATPTPAPGAAPAVPGPLPGAPSCRALGLAVTVAAVLLVGVASLLLRLLLARPVVSDRSARL